MQFSPDHILLLDGATGTELERRGVDTGLPLWSASAIIDAPDVLKTIHISYLESGADAIITNTFRTHERSLAKGGIGDQAESMTVDAVRIACAARDETKPKALVFGSVAPLEDCYRPDLVPNSEACQSEHRQMICYLVDSGVDLVLIETMCSARETMAAVEAAEDLCPGNWAISFCLAATDEPGVLLDGSSLCDLLPKLAGAQFIGINCVAASSMDVQVKKIRSMLSEDSVLAAYGNIGHVDHEQGWVNTDAIQPTGYAKQALHWVESGASIIGGCCGIGPHHIQHLAAHWSAATGAMG